jgi:hypothetical protein
MQFKNNYRQLRRFNLLPSDFDRHSPAWRDEVGELRPLKRSPVGFTELVIPLCGTPRLPSAVQTVRLSTPTLRSGQARSCHAFVLTCEESSGVFASPSGQFNRDVTTSCHLPGLCKNSCNPDPNDLPVIRAGTDGNSSYHRTVRFHLFRPSEQYYY